jgi:hypothetical protein
MKLHRLLILFLDISHYLSSSMSGEIPPGVANNSNIVDLLSTLNPAAAASTTTLTPSTATIRNDDINVDSSDFVPANRLLTQRQAMNNTKQRISKVDFLGFLFTILFYLFS